MRMIKLCAFAFCILLISCTTFASNYCLNCFGQIDEDEKYCTVCKVKLSVDELKNKEEKLIHAVTTSRKNYQKSLEGLKDYYQQTGNYLRFKKARRELEALTKVPQPVYTNEALGNVRFGVKLRDIEMANILYEDALEHKKSFNTQKQTLAIKRLEKIIKEYPYSNKVGDAAFEIAEIYESYSFEDYESAAVYYLKSYQLNPYIKRPALLKAGCMKNCIIIIERLKYINKRHFTVPIQNPAQKHKKDYLH